MPAAAKNASSNKTKLYMQKDYTHPNTKGYAGYAETSATTIVKATNEITQVNNVSGLGQSPNTTEYTIYGQDDTLKVAGSPTNEDLTIEFLTDRNNVLHKAIMDTYSINDSITVGIHILTSTTNGSIYIVDCVMASIAPGFQPDQPGISTLTLSPTGKGIWYDKT